MSITELGREAARSSSSDDDGGSSGGQAQADDYERIDVSDLTFTKMHPGPTAIAGTAEALRYFPPAPDDAEYDDNGRGSAGVVLGNPTIPDDDDFDSVSIFKSTSQSGDDFKVVNTDDENVDVYDVGISVGQMFESEETDAFDVDETILTLSTSAGRSVTRTLDVRGLANADVVRNEDGAPAIQEDTGWPTTNDALIEKHPGNDDENYTPPRFSRDPQLRDDVEGEQVIIMLQRLAEIDPDYDGSSFWATVLADLPDERQQELAEGYANDDYMDGDEPADFIHEINGSELISLAPTMEFEPDDALLQATQWVEWSFPDEAEVERLREEQGVSVE
jgi:hypothetical protein